MMNKSIIITFAVLSMLPVTTGFAQNSSLPRVSFRPPEALSVSASQSNAHLSASAVSNTVFDTSGCLHLTWWSGAETVTPATPSSVYHCAWSREKGWSDEHLIAGFPATLGARQPSLSALDGGRVWIAWHDHRHCTASGNYIDNTELYGTVTDVDGVKIIDQRRLTQTVAEHKGDNAYCPKVLFRAPDTVYINWYDFHYNGWVSDIFLAKVNANNPLTPLDMASARLTNATTHAGKAYVQCDFSLMADGGVACVWGTGTTWMTDLMFMEVTPSGVVSRTSVVASSDVSYYDPACIRVSPTTGMSVVLWPSQEQEASQMRVACKPTASETFTMSTLDAREGVTQRRVDAEFDSAGRLHIVWADDRNGDSQIWYVCMNCETGEKSQPLCVSGDGAWVAAKLALDEVGLPYIVAQTENDSLSLIAPEKAGVSDWFAY